MSKDKQELKWDAHRAERDTIDKAIRYLEKRGYLCCRGLWDARRIAELLGVSSASVLNWDRDPAINNFPAAVVVTSGMRRTPRWKPQDIEAWIESRQQQKEST